MLHDQRKLLFWRKMLLSINVIVRAISCLVHSRFDVVRVDIVQNMHAPYQNALLTILNGKLIHR